MRALVVVVCVASLSACSSGVEGLSGDGGPGSGDARAPEDDAMADARQGADADAGTDAERDATPPDDTGATSIDTGVDAGLTPSCEPVVLSEADEDVTSAGIVAHGTGWRVFRASDSASVPGTRILEQHLDPIGQTIRPAASAGPGSRVDVHHGGGGYAVVFGGTVLIGPTPELRVTPLTGGIVGYRRYPDGNHALVRHVAEQLFVDSIQPGGGTLTVAVIPAARWPEVYAAALSQTQLAVVGTTTAGADRLAFGVRTIGADVPWSVAQLPTVLPSADAARVVWHDDRQEWLVAHSVQRSGTRYGDPHLTILAGRARVVLQQPLGMWGAWYGAPISVATTALGYALAWQTAEDIGGGTSGYNDFLLAVHVDASNAFSVEAAAPPRLAATGRLPPQVAWNAATGELGRLWIHRVGDFPPNAGRGQLVFQCGRP